MKGTPVDDDSADRTVLLVEDDPLVMLTVAAQLEDRGWCVKKAANGKVGVERLDEMAGEIDALVADIRLGEGPDGWEVAEHVRALRPDLPVVYITGDSAAHGLRSVPDSIILQKPHVFGELLDALEVLTAREARRPGDHPCR